jgi:cytoskeletal protein RodZ
MNGFFNFFKGLISGLFGVFSKKPADDTAALPKPRKRSSGYFLELDDAQSTSAPVTAAPKAVEKAPAAQPVAVATAEPAAPAAKPKTSRKEKLAALAATNGEVSKADAAAMTPVKPEPATANQALNLPQPTVTTFAPEYLLPKATSTRRRPGANMSSFLTMARQVKTPG